MTSENKPSGFPNRSPDLFYELARDRLWVQLEAVDAVDTKIGLLVSLASALTGILAGVLALRGHSLNALQISVVVLFALVYAGISYKGIQAYFSKKWKTGATLPSAWKLLRSDTDDDLVKWKVARAFWESLDENTAPFNKKAEVLPFLLVGVVIQAFLLGALAFSLALGAG
jgi:hypothetical protein